MIEVTDTQELPEIALHLLKATDFKPYIRKNFPIHFTKGDPVAAQLKAVRQLPGYSNLERKPFSILFQTEQGTPFYQQAMYTIEHPALGRLTIFLVPVGVQGKGMQYEAVFS